MSRNRCGNGYWAIRILLEGEKVADVNADSLVLGGGAPVYDRATKEPDYLQEIAQYNIDQIEEPKDL